jgi:hypothetical protein
MNSDTLLTSLRPPEGNAGKVVTIDSSGLGYEFKTADQLGIDVTASSNTDARLPAATSGDSGKELTVDSGGNYVLTSQPTIVTPSFQNAVTVNSLNAGVAATASLAETSTGSNVYALTLGIPKGDKGDMPTLDSTVTIGAPNADNTPNASIGPNDANTGYKLTLGIPNPVAGSTPTLSGTVIVNQDADGNATTPTTASASLTDQGSNNYQLKLDIPKGDPGAAPTFQTGANNSVSVNVDASGNSVTPTSAAAFLESTSTANQYKLRFLIPKGDAGSTPTFMQQADVREGTAAASLIRQTDTNGDPTNEYKLDITIPPGNPGTTPSILSTVDLNTNAQGQAFTPTQFAAQFTEPNTNQYQLKLDIPPGPSGKTPVFLPSDQSAATRLASNQTPTASVTRVADSNGVAQSDANGNPRYNLALGIPEGAKGDKPTFESGVDVNLDANGALKNPLPTTASASIVNGTSGDYKLKLDIPQGAPGETPTFNQTVNVNGSGVPTTAGASISGPTGSPPQYTLNLDIPKGDTGPAPTIQSTVDLTTNAGAATAAINTISVPNADDQYQLALNIPPAVDGKTPTLNSQVSVNPNGTPTAASASISGPTTVNGNPQYSLSLNIPPGTPGQAGGVGTLSATVTSGSTLRVTPVAQNNATTGVLEGHRLDFEIPSGAAVRAMAHLAADQTVRQGLSTTTTSGFRHGPRIIGDPTTNDGDNLGQNIARSYPGWDVEDESPSAIIKAQIGNSTFNNEGAGFAVPRDGTFKVSAVVVTEGHNEQEYEIQVVRSNIVANPVAAWWQTATVVTEFDGTVAASPTTNRYRVALCVTKQSATAGTSLRGTISKTLDLKQNDLVRFVLIPRGTVTIKATDTFFSLTSVEGVKGDAGQNFNPTFSAAAREVAYDPVNQTAAVTLRSAGDTATDGSTVAAGNALFDFDIPSGAPATINSITLGSSNQANLVSGQVNQYDLVINPPSAPIGNLNVSAQVGSPLSATASDEITNGVRSGHNVVFTIPSGPAVRAMAHLSGDQTVLAGTLAASRTGSNLLEGPRVIGDRVTDDSTPTRSYPGWDVEDESTNGLITAQTSDATFNNAGAGFTAPRQGTFNVSATVVTEGTSEQEYEVQVIRSGTAATWWETAQEALENGAGGTTTNRYRVAKCVTKSDAERSLNVTTFTRSDAFNLARTGTDSGTGTTVSFDYIDLGTSTSFKTYDHVSYDHRSGDALLNTRKTYYLYDLASLFDGPNPGTTQTQRYFAVKDTQWTSSPTSTNLNELTAAIGFSNGRTGMDNSSNVYGEQYFTLRSDQYSTLRGTISKTLDLQQNDFVRFVLIPPTGQDVTIKATETFFSLTSVEGAKGDTGPAGVPAGGSSTNNGQMIVYSHPDSSTFGALQDTGQVIKSKLPFNVLSELNTNPPTEDVHMAVGPGAATFTHPNSAVAIPPAEVHIPKVALLGPSAAGMTSGQNERLLLNGMIGVGNPTADLGALSTATPAGPGHYTDAEINALPTPPIGQTADHLLRYGQSGQVLTSGGYGNPLKWTTVSSGGGGALDCAQLSGKVVTDTYSGVGFINGYPYTHSNSFYFQLSDYDTDFNHGINIVGTQAQHTVGGTLTNVFDSSKIPMRFQIVTAGIYKFSAMVHYQSTGTIPDALSLFYRVRRPTANGQDTYPFDIQWSSSVTAAPQAYESNMYSSGSNLHARSTIEASKMLSLNAGDELYFGFQSNANMTFHHAHNNFHLIRIR